MNKFLSGRVAVRTADGKLILIYQVYILLSRKTRISILQKLVLGRFLMDSASEPLIYTSVSH